MRKLSLLLTTLLVAALTYSCQPSADTKSHADQANMKEVSFEVNGNCGMCKKTIEGSLADFSGVQEADWDVETGILSVSYDPEATSLQKIGEKVASVGYENEYADASQEAYNDLAPCCQYEKKDM